MTVTCMFRRLMTANVRQAVRNFRSTPIIRDGAYEGDGKTTLSILNKDYTYGLMIDSYSEVGFRLNNGIMIIGPMALFPKTVLSWKVKGIADINPASLSLFSVLEPKLDVLIIGIGNGQRTPEFDKTIINYANKYKMNMEVVPTPHACAIFNFLNAEGRFVGAGIIPPNTVEPTESEILDSPENLKFLNGPTGL